MIQYLLFDKSQNSLTCKNVIKYKKPIIIHYSHYLYIKNLQLPTLIKMMRTYKNDILLMAQLLGFLNALNYSN